MKELKKRTLTVECDCIDDDFITFLNWENDEDTHQVYVFITAKMYSLKHKLRACLDILRKGHCENFGPILNQSHAEKIIDFLTEVYDLDKPKL